MQGCSTASDDRLTAAEQQLQSVLNGSHSIEVIGTAIQTCCAEISSYFGVENQNIPPRAVVDVMGTLKSALNFIAQQAATPEDTLSALRADFWEQSLFPTIDSSCFNEK